MTDEELLQLVRDFTEENGREPMQADVLYDRELKATLRTVEPHAGAGGHKTCGAVLPRQDSKGEEKTRARHKEYRRQIREQAGGRSRAGGTGGNRSSHTLINLFTTHKRVFT